MCHRLSVTCILCMKHIAKALPSSKRKLKMKISLLLCVMYRNCCLTTIRYDLAVHIGIYICERVTLTSSSVAVFDGVRMATRNTIAAAADLSLNPNAKRVRIIHTQSSSLAHKIIIYSRNVICYIAELSPFRQYIYI